MSGQLMLTLERLAQTAFATYGQIVDAENKLWCVTLERPWQHNEPNVSCVPAGTYQANRFPANQGKRAYDVFKLTGVPGRSDVELHMGNLPHDTEGCVLIGSNYGPVNGQPGITGSAVAFARFMDALRHYDTFTLVITDPPNPSPEHS